MPSNFQQAFNVGAIFRTSECLGVKKVYTALSALSSAHCNNLHIYRTHAPLLLGIYLWFYCYTKRRPDAEISNGYYITLRCIDSPHGWPNAGAANAFCCRQSVMFFLHSGTEKLVNWEHFSRTEDCLNVLKAQGVHIVAMETVDDQPTIYEYQFPTSRNASSSCEQDETVQTRDGTSHKEDAGAVCALVLGNERHGVSESTPQISRVHPPLKVNLPGLFCAGQRKVTTTVRCYCIYTLQWR